ncbi:hypothetical protein PF005_g2857 [Phytophthora fragariae]|uniref:Uncharacterized protein n=1 Tax=Phytophthora fragariae TaxID=53985 RepID=A0A6A3TEX8_9STRA|nr:hypothetical protein PF007_g2810 [Phytophthora fragariae]KAE9232047.1 hypothetical protein PF005_g2857 [Phytophthora fragariae]KAE9358649.1 hypothetical protein PF008_g2592 [Phytophthora fragariae]
MEGVVLVEMSSGALHYTRSFSEAFDARHPKTERLNLSALIFALQNFADSSTRSVGTTESATGGAEIVMFATPLENMVLAATPSKKLLVVLFTEPDFDANVAKWLVRRVAYNYENGESVEMQLMATLNQVPRRFRLAFSLAIDEAIEHQLVSLCEDIFLSRRKDLENVEGAPEDIFFFFHYAARLDDSDSNVNCDDEVEKRNSGTKVANMDDREEECRKAIRSVNPSLSDISRGSTQTLSIRNIMASTRAVISAPIKRGNSKKKKPKKKTRWGAKNAVMNHSEPHEFQRLLEVCWKRGEVGLMEPHRTGVAYSLAEVLLPFVELSAISLFAPGLATFARSEEIQERSSKLDQLVWKNISRNATTKEKSQQETSILAWRRGPCCVFYPITAISANPENKSRVRLAVAALFDVLEPMLRAKSKLLG